MKDLTRNSIANHVLRISLPLVINMLAQLVCQLVDLYFVSRIGVAAIAGVSAAGNAVFLINAIAQVLVAGTSALIAHAVGRRDQPSANLVFNQSLLLSMVMSVALMSMILILIRPYLRAVSTDTATIAAGLEFIAWVLPGFALILPMAVLSSALRGTGIVLPSVASGLLTVVFNIALAPTLIAGWGTDLPLGVKGAGLATALSLGVGATVLAAYPYLAQCYVKVATRQMRPNIEQWRRILTIGLPAGGDFALAFLSTAIVYYAIRDLGAASQAGFSVGWRVLQAILLPAMALTFAAAPIVGQNFGAKLGDRVKDTFQTTVLAAIAFMLAFTVLLQLQPATIARLFADDEAAVDVASLFLQYASWSLVAQGVVYTCCSMLLGLGRTTPLLIVSATRFCAFGTPVVWLSTRPSFQIEHVWCVFTASIVLQAAVGLWLLVVEFRKQLPSLA